MLLKEGGETILSWTEKLENDEALGQTQENRIWKPTNKRRKKFIHHRMRHNSYIVVVLEGRIDVKTDK